MYCIYLLALLLIIILTYVNSIKDDHKLLIRQLEESIKRTKEVLVSLKEEWQIDKYPYFYKNILLSSHSWNGLRDRYIKKIILSHIYNKPIKLIASFTGSSVTAGHDSNYTDSTPLQVASIMSRVFEPLSINFEVRNVALGNNPCMPYNLCVKYFVGDDTDIIQWEQNYFCEHNNIIENFIRECYRMKNKPIIFFSSSKTAKWGPTECKLPRELNELELRYISATPYEIFTDINRASLSHFSYYTQFLRNYSGSFFQFFAHHDSIEDYACQGPYIKDWMIGAASWHPTKIAHRFRASQISFLWLSIWLSSIENLLSIISNDNKYTLQILLNDINYRFDISNNVDFPNKIFNTTYPEDPYCLTDYEPRYNRETSLKSSVLYGLQEVNHDGIPIIGHEKLWKFEIYENIVSKYLVELSRERGYHDYKYTLYAPYGIESGPISILITPFKDGTYFVCEIPPIWGSLPKGYKHLDEGANVYLTENVTKDDIKNFQFNPNNSKQLELKKDSICYQLSYKGNDILKSGHHILTIQANSENPIILTWILYSS